MLYQTRNGEKHLIAEKVSVVVVYLREVVNIKNDQINIIRRP